MKKSEKKLFFLTLLKQKTDNTENFRLQFVFWFQYHVHYRIQDLCFDLVELSCGVEILAKDDFE